MFKKNRENLTRNHKQIKFFKNSVEIEVKEKIISKFKKFFL